jgi:phosphoribosylformylglycinamidine (FGAM) synthase-like enzyme
MLIGLGGGAASSITSGEGSVHLDFASVREVTRKCNGELKKSSMPVSLWGKRIPFFSFTM